MTYVGGALDFNAAHFVNVVAHESEGTVRVVVKRARPAASAEQVDDVGESGARIGSGGFGARQQGAERRLAGGVLLLEERHGTHAHACDATGTAVAHDVVSRHGRACEDESALAGLQVGGAADVVPDVRCDLPFVEETRRVALEDGLRVQECRLAGVGVGVEEHFACRRLPCGRGLAAGSRAFDQDGCGCAELLLELEVGEAG